MLLLRGRIHELLELRPSLLVAGWLTRRVEQRGVNAARQKETLVKISTTAKLKVVREAVGMFHLVEPIVASINSEREKDWRKLMEIALHKQKSTSSSSMRQAIHSFFRDINLVITASYCLLLGERVPH